MNISTLTAMEKANHLNDVDFAKWLGELEKGRNPEMVIKEILEESDV